MSDYFKLSPEKIAQLKRISNELSDTDLIALVAIAGLESTAAYCTEVVECGECEPDVVPADIDAYTECASDMMTDIINERDIKRVIAANDLAHDYIVKFEKRYVAVKK